MRHAGGAEIFLQVGGQAVVVAEEDAGEQSGLGVGQQLEDGGLGAGFEGVDGVVKRVALPFGQHGSAGQVHQTVDALPRQVIFVVEIAVAAWGFQCAAEPYLGTVGDGWEAEDAGLDEAGDGHGRSISQLDFRHRHPQIDRAVAHIRLIGHNAGNNNVGFAVVIGDVGGGDGGLHGRVSCPTKGQQTQAGQQQGGCLLSPQEQGAN